MTKSIKSFPFDPKNRTRLLLLILSIAFALRLFLILQPEVIHNDGTEYVRHVKQVLSGHWTAGKSAPLYPVLTAFASLITKDYEMAGIWISVIFGTLTVLAVFFLGKEIFGEAAGIVSALFAAVQPFLYMSSGSVLTESMYYFFLAASVLFGLKAFNQGRCLQIILFSLFTALAYLTRPEAVGFLLIFGVWVLFVNPPERKRGWVKRTGIILAVVVGFLIFSSPYLILLRKETGRWGISKKAAISIGNLSSEEEIPSIETIKKKKGVTLSAFVKNPFPVMGKAGIGFFDSLYKFQQVYNPALFILAILGWIFVFRRRPSSLKANFYLASHLVFFFGLIFPFFFITRRYTSQMISISIPWAAYGFLSGIEWVREGSPKWKWISEGKAPLVLLIILSAGLFIQGRVIHPREHREIQREAGLWIKDHLPREGKLMSKLPQEAFYAELPWVRMSEGSYEEVLKKARLKGARYLAVDEDAEKDSPGFWKKVRKEDIVSVKEFKKKDRRITVFEILPER